MATYLFVTRGIDITRKSITGPGVTLSSGNKRTTVELDDGSSDHQRLTILAEMCVNAGLNIGRKQVVAVDDWQRVIIYFRGLAVAALVPLNIWGGFLFVPRLEKSPR